MRQGTTPSLYRRSIRTLLTTVLSALQTWWLTPTECGGHCVSVYEQILASSRLVNYTRFGYYHSGLLVPLVDGHCNRWRWRQKERVPGRGVCWRTGRLSRPIWSLFEGCIAVLTYLLNPSFVRLPILLFIHWCTSSLLFIHLLICSFVQLSVCWSIHFLMI